MSDQVGSLVIGAVSQKGGVGKSTLNRLLAKEFIAGGYTAKIIDLDTNQNTCHEWAMERNKRSLEPFIPVQQYTRLDRALKDEGGQYDVLLLDGAPNSDRLSLKIAEASDLVIIPTGIGDDDIKPSKRLMNELVRSGVPKEKIVFALCKVVGTAKATVASAYYSLKDEGYDVLEGAMRFQAGYIAAFNEGRAATETVFKTLNDEAEEMGNCVVERLKKLQRAQAGEAA